MSVEVLDHPGQLEVELGLLDLDKQLGCVAACAQLLIYLFVYFHPF